MSSNFEPVRRVKIMLPADRDFDKIIAHAGTTPLEVVVSPRPEPEWHALFTYDRPEKRPHVDAWMDWDATRYSFHVFCREGHIADDMEAFDRMVEWTNEKYRQRYRRTLATAVAPSEDVRATVAAEIAKLSAAQVDTSRLHEDAEASAAARPRPQRRPADWLLKYFK